MASPPPISALTLDGMLEGGELRPDKLIQALNQFTQPTAQALSKGLTFSANFRATVKDIRFTMPSDAPWIAPTFAGNWTNEDTATYNAAGYCMFPGGWVELRGTIDEPGDLLGTTAFTLPAGYRPPKKLSFATANNNDEFGIVVVNSNGTVVPTNTVSGGIDAWSIEGLRFVATTPVAPTAFSGTYGGNQWPLVVSHQLPGKCTGLVPLACVMKDGGPKDGVGNYSLDWEDKGDGQIRIKSAWGLQWAKTYTIKALLLSE